MGNIASSKSKSGLGICLTLDAFGTLYYPKKPIAVQYLEVARRCGLEANIQVPELEASFRKTFKDQSARYPNYGKSQGMSVESWWDEVVCGAFRPFCRGHTVPDSLAPSLFQHFSSRDAYALYPDVLPFFQVMQELRQKYSDPKGPIILVGIITNSDSRARTVVESLGLQVGHEQEHTSTQQTMKIVLEDGKQPNREGQWQGRKFEGMSASGSLLHSYNSTDDINFLVTSYAIGSEKPGVEIFAEANKFAAILPMSRLEQMSPHESIPRSPFTLVGVLPMSFKLTHIHVGDDFEKDYQGAKNANHQALHLCRDNKTGEFKNYQIPDLLELGTVIKLMADTDFSPSRTSGK